MRRQGQLASLRTRSSASKFMEMVRSWSRANGRYRKYCRWTTRDRRESVVYRWKHLINYICIGDLNYTTIEEKHSILQKQAISIS
jgi:hypothetical protein